MYESNMGAENANGTRIANFNLFGEAGELPDVVHCETIEIRSQLHDWVFRPHRHARLHQLLLLDDGGGRAVLEERTHALRPGTLVNVPAGCVHGFTFLRDTTGWVVTLSSELLDEVLRADEGLRPVLARPAVARRDAHHRYLVGRIFHEHGQRGFGRAHVLRALAALLLGHVARTLQDLHRSDMPRADNPLLVRFERLLEENFRNRWGVADYAGRLSVSPTHLSRVTRAATGLSAARVIEERVIREARRQLVFTNLGISQIAYLLGFGDPAHFSRVFSRATGLSPRAFRAQIERGG